MQKFKVVSQELMRIGVLTTWENGMSDILPYLISENGEHYVEINPELLPDLEIR
jgi:hypothetical protein